MAALKFIDNISPENCNATVQNLITNFYSITESVQITRDNLTNLQYFCSKGVESVENDRFSKPVVWIGVYMAVASLVCIFCILAGIWKEYRYQNSSKYTSLNVTSMMVIAIAMKLTVDLTGSMPSNLDQMAKIGSVAFMCTILAIFNPSLASMNNKSLFSNVVGLVIFIVTMAVNLFIEIDSGVIRNENEAPKGHVGTTEDGLWETVDIKYSADFANLGYVYTSILILLLLISISTALNIPSVKKVLEYKYQEALKKDVQQHSRISTVEEVTQHVTKYWVMAKTGSPEFVIGCNSLSYTALLLCLTGLFLFIYVLGTLNERNVYDTKLESDYRWSISVMLWVQFGGNILGVLLLTFRCIRGMIFIGEFTDLFNLRAHKYWDQKFSHWKRSHLGFRSSGRRSSRIRFMKNCGVSILVGIQKILVELNKCLAYICMVCLKFFIELIDEVEHFEVLEINSKKWMNHLVEKAKKKQNKHLLVLLGKSKGFEGVENFDDIDKDFGFNDDGVFSVNSWSIPVVTLTCIAIAVPDISDAQINSLIHSIDEALLYTLDVEKRFNNASIYANIRKTYMTLWYEVRAEQKWMGKAIGEGACGKLPRDILTCLAAKAKTILDNKKISSSIKEHKIDIGNESWMIEFPNEMIGAHSMHRISNSILLSKLSQDKIETNESFFEHLSSMIADILVACFSNIPQVIKMKCHEDEIEKREASVEVAAKLLGRTTEIMKMLQASKLPSIDPDKRPSIHEWRIHLKTQSSISSNSLP